MGVRHTNFCDRCGWEIPFSVPLALTFVVGVEGGVPGTQDLPKRLDLCEKCVDDFTEWRSEELPHADMLDTGAACCADCSTASTPVLRRLSDPGP